MRALTIGGIAVDVIASLADSEIGRMTMHGPQASYLLAEPGKKVEATGIVQAIGGGGANTAVALARLGWDVGVLGKTGDDIYGAGAREHLSREGIDTSTVAVTGEAPTGTAVMIMASDRDPAVFIARGANTRFRLDDVPDDAFENRDLVCVTNLSGPSADCFPELVSRAKRAGAKVLAIPGIRQISSRGEYLLKVLPEVDYLIINRREANQMVPLLDRYEHDQLTLEAPEAQERDEDRLDLLWHGFEEGGFRASLGEFFRCLTGLGVGTVAVTDGANGAYAAFGEEMFFCSPPRTQIASSVGAGDSLASTLSGLLAEGLEPGEALIRAVINAAAVITKVDTQSGLLTRGELDRRAGEFDRRRLIRLVPKGA